MKARWLFLSLTLAFAATALLGVDAAGAKPPAAPKPPKSPKSPPPGTPGVARTGTPGTITVTHYATDGTTVLSIERFNATARDNSASVAAKLGPDRARRGQDGRGDATGTTPAARTPRWPRSSRRPARARLAARSARSRRSDCCSSSGCDAVDVTRDITGDIFGDWIGTFHHRVYWCWSYPKITGVNVACWSTWMAASSTITAATAGATTTRWSGSGHGGHVSFREGDWENCIFHYGCFKNIYPVDRDLGERQRRLGAGSRRLRSRSSKPSSPRSFSFC